jgi:hypothetical protein
VHELTRASAESSLMGLAAEVRHRYTHIDRYIYIIDLQAHALHSQPAPFFEVIEVPRMGPGPEVRHVYPSASDHILSPRFIPISLHFHSESSSDLLNF